MTYELKWTDGNCEDEAKYSSLEEAIGAGDELAAAGCTEIYLCGEDGVAIRRLY